jgi:hypothetical protein
MTCDGFQRRGLSQGEIQTGEEQVKTVAAFHGFTMAVWGDGGGLQVKELRVTWSMRNLILTFNWPADQCPKPADQDRLCP